MSVSTVAKQLRKAARIILVGAPGVGKGTQSERLIKRYPQLASIATGDLLRDNVKNNTPLGERDADFVFWYSANEQQASRQIRSCAPASSCLILSF